MSVLSTITSSLPNVLNLLQGKWDVQYKIGKADKASTWSLQGMRELATSARAWLNGQQNPNDGFEWKSLDFDSFVDINEVADTNIVTNPVEGGSFRSVNKIRKPKIIKVTLAKAGIGYGIEDSLAEIKMLLPLARYNKQKVKRYGLNAFVENAKDSVVGFISDLFGAKTVKKKDSSIPMEFRIVTPFDMIQKLNLIKLDYTFKQDTGRNMLLIYLTFQEIIEKDGRLKKEPINPTNASKENVGRVSLGG